MLPQISDLDEREKILTKRDEQLWKEKPETPGSTNSGGTQRHVEVQQSATWKQTQGRDTRAALSLWKEELWEGDTRDTQRAPGKDTLLYGRRVKTETQVMARAALPPATSIDLAEQLASLFLVVAENTGETAWGGPLGVYPRNLLRIANFRVPVLILAHFGRYALYRTPVLLPPSVPPR